MNEQEPQNRIDDVSKARLMADAEKPFRDEKIALLSQRQQQFTERFHELQRIVNDDTAELSEIKPNDDEKQYANDGTVPTEGYISTVGRAIDTGPENTARIAKALIENDSVRAHRVATLSRPDLKHPQDVAIDEQKEKIKRDFSFPYWDDYGPTLSSANQMSREAAERLNQSLDQPVQDSSRSIAGDKAGDEAGKKYDDRQKLKEELSETA